MQSDEVAFVIYGPGIFDNLFGSSILRPDGLYSFENISIKITPSVIRILEM